MCYSVFYEFFNEKTAAAIKQAAENFSASSANAGSVLTSINRDGRKAFAVLISLLASTAINRFEFRCVLAEHHYGVDVAFIKHFLPPLLHSGVVLDRQKTAGQIAFDGACTEFVSREMDILHALVG